MTAEIDTGGPAFPCGRDITLDRQPSTGMALRDYFAAKALECVIGLMSDNGLAAMEAYKIADAMIAERIQK